jgi:hypothetical protein
MTDSAAAVIITPLKLLHTRIAERAGKITRAEISSEPTRFIARAIIIAVKTEMRRLHRDVLIPEASEKSSSKVTRKILL